MMPNQPNINFVTPGQHPCPCPTTPIVCPTQVRTVCRCFTYPQPVIVPTHTRVINNFYPRPHYVPTFTTSEEDVCHGRMQGNPGTGPTV